MSPPTTPWATITWRQGDLQDAFEAYKNALLLDPNDADAKYNLELTLAGLQQQQPSPDQQGQQQQGQGSPAPGQPGDGQAPPDQSQQQQQPGGNATQGQPPQGQPQQPAQGPQGNQPANQADVQRQLQDALAGIDQNFSFDDAEHVLDLLNQLREQRPQSGNGGEQGGPDY